MQFKHWHILKKIVYLGNHFFYIALKKFVGKIIIDKTKKLNSDGFSFLYEENKEGIHSKPQLLYLLKSSTLPVQYKYNAFLVN